MDSSYLECPVCLQRYEGKIFLCDTGHGLCENCSKIIKKCPKCTKPMTTKRNFDMESLVKVLVETVKVKCGNNGCNYKITAGNEECHKFDCKYRMHLCQVAAFSKLNCHWIGTYDEIFDHYKKKHPDNSRLTAVTKSVHLQCRFVDFKNAQLISFLDGKQLFYYKHKVDQAKEMMYWLFQFVGPSKEAKNYTYEFEINRDHRKYKINGICAGDTEDHKKLFEEEDCVCLSFKQIKHFLSDENEIDVRFRIANLNHVFSKEEKPKIESDEKIKAYLKKNYEKQQQQVNKK